MNYVLSRDSLKSGDLNRRPAAELARLIRKKSISPVELLLEHLHAVERLNPKVNAICTLAADSAMAAAKRAEQDVMDDKQLGSLHGLPIGIKDVTPTGGIRTTYGSLAYADHVPTDDALVVSRLKEAGGIILGKTNTPEFAAGANTVNAVFGATRNPWNLALSVGGSTGGGAAAVACGMIALAAGTDFGGSLRVPAAFCGVVGLRPTAGVVPRFPTPLPWDVGSVDGPLGRTVEDIALMLEAMAGGSNLSPISTTVPWRDLQAVTEVRDLKQLRIGYTPDLAQVGIDRAIEDVCTAAVHRIERHVGSVEQLDFSLADGRDAYIVLRGLTMVSRFVDQLEQIEQFGPNLKGNIKSGLKLTIQDVARAERKRAELWDRCCKLFEKVDLLLTPTTPVAPFPVEQNYPETISGRKLETYIDWIAPTFLVTLCGLPAASVPCGQTSAGLPIGLQIIGPRFAEPDILGAAKLVEHMNPVDWPPIVKSDDASG